VTVVRAGRDHVRAVRLDPRDRRRVLVTTRPGQAGAYTVTWRVRAADGHAVEGTLGFRARRGAASPAPAGMPSIATALARAESGALALARGLAG
jgi:hypothetical protein